MQTVVADVVPSEGSSKKPVDGGGGRGAWLGVGECRVSAVLDGGVFVHRASISGSCTRPFTVDLSACPCGMQRWLRVRCGRCESCRKVRRSALIERVRRGANDRRSCRWVVAFTFTRGVSRDEVRRAWAIFRWRIGKHVGRRGLGKPGYFLVWELTKRGRWHLHCVLAFDGAVSRRALERSWPRGRWGAGFIHARLIQGTGHRAIGYIAKYVAKGLYERHVGRCWSSSKGFGGIKWERPHGPN